MKKKLLWGAVAVAFVLGFYASTQIPIASRVKQLFEQEFQLGNISPHVQNEIGEGTNPVASAQLKEQLTATYTADEAHKNYASIVALFKNENGQTLDNRFENVDFQIHWWEGSYEKDGILTAKFIGIPKLTRNGQVSDGACWGEYEVSLEKESPQGQWLFRGWQLNEFYNCR